MRNFCFYLFCFAINIVLWTSCAQVSSPQGGPEDVTPPQIDSTKTTPNFQTNFQKQKFEITFDEWIKLNDVFNQVIVSPPLEFNPVITLRKRTVLFNFHEEEILRPNATYTINFGKAIKDITEGNVVEDLRYVFSTGDYIDSLVVKGTLIDAFTLEPVKDMMVMLYDNLSDTIVKTERPFYFSRTNDNGAFQISNVKAGAFKVFAAPIDRFNYPLNLEGKEIGFLNESIIVSDTIQTTVQIQISKNLGPLRLQKKETNKYGLVKLVYNQKPENLDIKIQGLENQQVYKLFEIDTLNVWYTNSENKAWQLILNKDTLYKDTINVPAINNERFKKSNKLVRVDRHEIDKAKKLNPTKEPHLLFNHPLLAIDTSKIRIFEDSIKTIVDAKVRIDSADHRILLFDFPWKENMFYQVEILPEGLNDFFNLKNDTLTQGYEVMSKEIFGDIELNIDGLDPKQQYILHLLFQKNNLVEEKIIKDVAEIDLYFKTIPAGEYLVRIIEDLNKNNHWDSNSYEKGTQAEKLIYRPLETLRANWEIVKEISWKK